MRRGVAETIYLNVRDAPEGAALVRSLSRRRLAAALVRTDACWQVEVRPPGDDARDFLADLGVALAALAREGGAT